MLSPSPDGEPEAAPNTVDNLAPAPASTSTITISQLSTCEQLFPAIDMERIVRSSKPKNSSQAHREGPALQGAPALIQGGDALSEISFHFFLSDDPAHGAIAKPISACLTPDAFFDAALSAWRIGCGRQDPIIIALKVSWDGAKRLSVVPWRDHESFRSMISAVGKAIKASAHEELEVEVTCIPQRQSSFYCGSVMGY